MNTKFEWDEEETDGAPVAALREEVLDSYDLDDAGIPYRVTLENAVIADIDIATREIVATAIPLFDQLVALIAVRRCHRAEKLNGDDLRFFRRVLSMSAKAFAEAIRVDPATLSRWESGAQTPGETQDRLIRLFVCEKLVDKAPGFPIDRMCIMQIGHRAAPTTPGQISFSFRLETVRDRISREKTTEWDEIPTAA